MAKLENVVKWLQHKKQKSLNTQLLQEAQAVAWENDDAMETPATADVGVCVAVLTGLIAKEVKRWKPDLIEPSTSARDWLDTARALFDEDRAAQRGNK